MESGTNVGINGDASYIQFLLRHRGNAKYLVVVPEAQDAAPIILATGQPVIAMGGFMGWDDALTVANLEEMVKAGELKYFEVDSSSGGGQSGVSGWVLEHGKAVAADEYEGTEPAAGRGTTLYVLSAAKI